MPRRLWWIGALICGVTTGLFLLVMLFNPLGITFTTWLDDIGEGVAAAFAAVCCAFVLRRVTGPSRVAWCLLAAASASWAIGEGIWCWYQLVRNIEVPFPSFADLFFLLAVPLMTAGVLVLGKVSGAVTHGVKALLEGAIIAGSLLFVSWATALSTVLNTGGEGVFAKTVGLAYPVGDIVTATVALAALSRAKGAYRRQLGLLAGGVIFLALSDSMFAYLTQNGTYGNGNWMDTGWVAGFLLIGIAALAPGNRESSESRERGETPLQLALPYIPLSFAGLTAGIEEATGRSIGGTLLTIGVATTALVLARQFFTLVDNQKLNRKLESTVASLEAREIDLARQAFHDPLTSLCNRVLLTDRLNHAIDRHKRDGATLAVILCDLDEFKSVNDTLGHLAGDDVLKQVAERLKLSVRQADTIARIGGDEFALLLENLPSHDDALRAVERIGQMLRTPFQLDRSEVTTTTSVGVVFAPTSEAPDPNADDLLRSADIAMYEAKYSGKNCFRVFEPNMLDGVLSKLQLKSELGSLGNHLGQLTLHFQPMISAKNGRLTGVEALMRWQHPTRGLLFPPSFMSYAEEAGAIVPIGAAAIDMACAQAVAWRDLGIACPSMAVNLSPRQLHDSGAIDMIRRALEKYSLDPEDLTIEVTESITMRGADLAVARLHELKDLGVSISIDDFGTGWSSLAQLRHLPVDFVKFNHSFTAEVATDRDAALLITFMNKLAHSLGLETVAEGVENAEQLEAIQDLGCDHVQGFHIARPQPASQATELIRAYRSHSRRSLRDLESPGSRQALSPA